MAINIDNRHTCLIDNIYVIYTTYMKTVIMIAEIAQKLNDAGQEKTQDGESCRQQEGQGGEEGRGSLVEMALKV